MASSTSPNTVSTSTAAPQDQVVKPPVVEALVQFYRLLGVGDGAMKAVNTVPSGHAMITPDFGNECGSNAAPGIVFVPASCASGTPCRVHIAFHGCSQSAGSVDDKFYAHAGYNRWADTNQLIVLYPQVNRSLLNPQGCWDWVGYTGRDYADSRADGSCQGHGGSAPWCSVVDYTSRQRSDMRHIHRVFLFVAAMCAASPTAAQPTADWTAAIQNESADVVITC